MTQWLNNNNKLTSRQDSTQERQLSSPSSRDLAIQRTNFVIAPDVICFKQLTNCSYAPVGSVSWYHLWWVSLTAYSHIVKVLTLLWYSTSALSISQKMHKYMFSSLQHLKENGKLPKCSEIEKWLKSYGTLWSSHFVSLCGVFLRQCSE